MKFYRQTQGVVYFLELVFVTYSLVQKSNQCKYHEFMISNKTTPPGWLPQTCLLLPRSSIYILTNNICTQQVIVNLLVYYCKFCWSNCQFTLSWITNNLDSVSRQDGLGLPSRYIITIYILLSSVMVQYWTKIFEKTATETFSVFSKSKSLFHHFRLLSGFYSLQVTNQETF